MIGAETPAAMVKLRVTEVAALKSAVPDWLATIVHVPAVFVVTVLPLMEHTEGVVVLYEIVRPALDVAAIVGLPPMTAFAGCGNVMV